MALPAVNSLHSREISKKQNIAQERAQKGLLSCTMMRDFRGLIKVN